MLLSLAHSSLSLFLSDFHLPPSAPKAQVLIINTDMSVPLQKSSDRFTDRAITASASAATIAKVPSGSRQFQLWDGGAGESVDLSSGGWSAAEMRATNEARFGVKSTYNELHYTTAIDTTTPDYEEKVRRADIIARDMERSRGRSARAEASEEERYSAVVHTKKTVAPIDGQVLTDVPDQRSATTAHLQDFSLKFKLSSSNPSATQATTAPMHPPAQLTSVPADSDTAASAPNAAPSVAPIGRLVYNFSSVYCLKFNHSTVEA